MAIETLTVADLREGDVLLYRGPSFISWAIRLFDNSEVNHASLVCPDGKVAEAVWEGVRLRPITESIKGSKIYVRRHANTPAPISRVTGIAAEYASSNVAYGYDQLVLLAALSLVSTHAPINRFLLALVRLALNAAAAVLDRLYERARGTKTMICSELVFRCYDEARTESNDEFTILVPGVNTVDIHGLTAIPSGRSASKPRPGSVLAEIERASGGKWQSIVAGRRSFQGIVAAGAVDPPASPDTLRLSVEDAARIYQESIEEGDFTYTDGDLLDPPLLASLQAYARSFTLAPSAATLVEGHALPAWLVTPEVVTPGGLYKSESLIGAGVI